jgi:FlaA1/EpsC-like NDP-sugar epimerase
MNISTDKAAHPTSVLGATKRIAEGVAAGYADGSTRIASVRFGNVLGSRGSLLTSLAWQVANDRPVTVTDPDVTRYFMTIPEAASLVIEAAVMARRGETYVLDMGEPVLILDLVQRFLDVVGAPGEIVFTGLRDGEKIAEQLVDEGREVTTATSHPRISEINLRESLPAGFAVRVDELCEAARAARPEDLLAALWNLATVAPALPAATVELQVAS